MGPGHHAGITRPLCGLSYSVTQAFKAKPHGASLRSQIALILFSPALPDAGIQSRGVGGSTGLYKLQMETVFPKPAAWHPVVE